MRLFATPLRKPGFNSRLSLSLTSFVLLPLGRPGRQVSEGPCAACLSIILLPAHLVLFISELFMVEEGRRLHIADRAKKCSDGPVARVLAAR